MSSGPSLGRIKENTGLLCKFHKRDGSMHYGEVGLSIKGMQCAHVCSL